MKERPILFNGAMVRALLSGTKTQTRRVLKQATGPSLSVGMDDNTLGVAELSWLWGDGPGHDVHETIKRVPCPHGQPGDRLWVRETFGHFERNDNFTPGCEVFYRADGECLAIEPWRPSIHMPRWASRITLEVTSVRLERLQDISEADAQAEGWTRRPEVSTDPQVHKEAARDWFMDLWESINGHGSWDANPWVWVVEFRTVEVAAK